MTEISRSIEIVAPREKVWAYLDPKNWPKIFDSVKEVNVPDGSKQGVGVQAKVVAGDGETPSITYNLEITEFKKNELIVYRRYGGPLSGKGLIQLKPLQNGTLLIRTSYFDDDLSSQTIQSLGSGLEKDNKKIKTQIEAQSKKGR